MHDTSISLLNVGCRKDDYAFFLQPVDLAAVPNYTDIIARPMDLGTMTTKVEKGKYRSLEEFAVRPLAFYRSDFSPSFICAPHSSSKLYRSLLQLLWEFFLSPYILHFGGTSGAMGSNN